MSFAKLVTLLETSPFMEYIALFFIFNLLIVVVEIILDLVNGKVRRWKDSLANFCIFLVNQLLEKTLVGIIGIVALMPFHYLSPLEIPATWWSWVLAVLAADFTYYWMHRIEHQSRILWGNHSVHHSSEDYNLSVSWRLSWVEPLIEWIFLIPMILIGFDDLGSSFWHL